MLALLDTFLDISGIGPRWTKNHHQQQAGITQGNDEGIAAKLGLLDLSMASPHKALILEWNSTFVSWCITKSPNQSLFWCCGQWVGIDPVWGQWVGIDPARIVHFLKPTKWTWTWSYRTFQPKSNDLALKMRPWNCEIASENCRMGPASYDLSWFINHYNPH